MSHFNSARQLAQRASDRQVCLSTHSLYNSTPFFSACLLVLNVREVDSIRLLSVVWFWSRSKTMPREYHRCSGAGLPLHKTDSLHNGSFSNQRPVNLVFAYVTTTIDRLGFSTALAPR